MYKTRLQKYFNTRNIPGKLQSINKQHVLSNQVSTVHCVTQHSAWLCSFVCCSKLNYIMLLVCCKFSEPATYFIHQWFCKFLSALSPPNNQELQTSVFVVLRSRGTTRAPAVFCNILCHKWAIGNFLLPVFEVILWHSYFWGGKSAVGCRMLRRANYRVGGEGRGGGGNA